MVRIYKIQCGIRHAPLILIYASIQALKCIEKFGIPEEQSYLVSCIAECSSTWSIAGQVQGLRPAGDMDACLNLA
jgi:hypothetical protein